MEGTVQWCFKKGGWDSTDSEDQFSRINTQFVDVQITIYGCIHMHPNYLLNLIMKSLCPNAIKYSMQYP